MGEFKGGDEAGLLVQAAEITSQVDDSVLLFEGFIGQGVIEVIEGLFDFFGIVGAHVLVIGIVQQFQDGICIGAKLLHIHGSILRIACRQVEPGVGVELLEFDLGFEAVLGFHYHVHQFVVVFVPFLDTPEVAGSAFVVDDEWHNAMAQAFLKENQSTNATVAVLEGEYLLEADMEVQNVVTLDIGLLFVAGDQFC